MNCYDSKNFTILVNEPYIWRSDELVDSVFWRYPLIAFVITRLSNVNWLTPLLINKCLKSRPREQSIKIGGDEGYCTPVCPRF